MTEALDAAYAEINAIGGYASKDDVAGTAINETVDQALAILAKHGAMDPLLRKATHNPTRVAAPELLQTVKDLVGLAAIRPGRLGDYKAALDDARALIARAEGSPTP